jgi:hypothetical protein
VNTPSPTRPWHLYVVAIYLLVAGLWTGGILLWTLTVRRTPLLPHLDVVSVGALMATACFAAGYALFRGSKFALLFIIAIPVLQWLAFARLYPDQVGPAGYSLDLAYFRQLPPLLLANLAFYAAIVLYALFLWKRKRLN